MPARANRRSGKYAEVDHQILQAVIEKEVMRNSGRYEELIAELDRRQQELAEESERVAEERRKAMAAVEEREAALQVRINNLQTLIKEIPSALSDAGLDSYERG